MPLKIGKRWDTHDVVNNEVQVKLRRAELGGDRVAYCTMAR